MSKIRNIEVGGTTYELQLAAPGAGGSSVLYPGKVYTLATIAGFLQLTLVNGDVGYCWQYHFFFIGGAATVFSFIDGNGNAISVEWAKEFSPAEGKNYEVDILYEHGLYKGIFIES